MRGFGHGGSISNAHFFGHSTMLRANSSAQDGFAGWNSRGKTCARFFLGASGYSSTAGLVPALAGGAAPFIVVRHPSGAQIE